MEFLIIAPNQSQRAAQFQRFVAGQGHGAARIDPDQHMPAAKECWLGAVLFDGAVLQAPNRESLRYLGIPLVTADAIGDPALADEQILQDLQARCHIEPLAPEVRRQLVEPLVMATDQTLSQMAGAEAIVRSVYQRDQPAALGDVSVTLTLSQSLEGLLIVSFSRSTAEALARRIVADAGDALDAAMVADCMGEIANIIAGQAKALFHGTPNHFIFSTPRVTIGDQGMEFKDGMKGIVIALECEQGAFALQLCRG